MKHSQTLSNLSFNHLPLVLQLPDDVVHAGRHIEAFHTGKMIRDVLFLQHQLGRVLQLEGEPPPFCLSCHHFLGVLGLDNFGETEKMW